MTILSTDIKLLESERMRDTADGGGRMTSHEIPDGVAGNVFPKVSRLDSVYGRVNLRKIYAAVRTPTLDVYAGAHCVITDPPDNDKIRTLLFSTGSHFDTRQEARDRIESYVVAGPESRWFLYGNQLIGQKAVTMYTRENEPLPDIGDVLCLSAESGAMAGTQQYIRVTDVESEVRTFADDRGDFSRRVVTIKISNPLRHTYTGDTMTRYSIHPVETAALVRETQVADASTYYGIMGLIEAANSGAMSVTVPSAYDYLVPSAMRETAISAASIAEAMPTSLAGSQSIQVVKSGVTAENPIEIVMPRGIYPGSLMINAAPADDGFGTITGTFTGSINYESGLVTAWQSGSVISGTFDIACSVGVATAHPSHTHEISITLATRGTVYAVSLIPIPAPGTLIVDYRALGRWYRLRDNGFGQLAGNDAGYGTGSVDYVTGGAVLTLGALPDVGSAIILSWGTPAHYKVLTTNSDQASKEFTVDHPPIAPGSIDLSWAEASVAKTATDDGAGHIAGTTASGTVDYATGVIRVNFNRCPDGDVAVAYDQQNGSTSAAGTGNTHNAGVALAPYSVWVSYSLTAGSGVVHNGVAVDDGVGNLRFSVSHPDLVRVGGLYINGTALMGSVNYATGAITLANTVACGKPVWNGATGQWDAGSDSATLTAHDFGWAHGSPTQTTQTFTVGNGIALTVILGKADPMYIVPGSVLFTAAGKTYVDRNGTLYTDIDAITGSGTVAGTIDYATGAVVVGNVATTANLGLDIQSCLGRYGEWTMTAAQFRTPGSPVRAASMYVQASTPAGALLTATADVNGVLSGSAGVAGTINQAMGVASISWGQAIMPSTLRFSCVVQTNLPLDADVLGLDPVRLPSDGRVAIYRPGDVCVIHDTQLYTLPNPAVASATYNVGRINLSLLELIDASGVDVPTSKYVANLSAGTVTMAADLSLTGYTQPLQARHRVEDMVLLSDVQITGEMALTAPLTHDYTTNSYLSSALLFGDLQAYVTTIFDQQTWTGVWSDTLIGSQANAAYDDLNHPIEVLNESAIKERWRLHFTSATAFQLYGEGLGLIADGDTSTDLAPVNPNTGQAYFVLRALGWGAGWSAGNQLRFNTAAGNAPVWIARTVLAGATLAGDSFDLAVRGDVD